MSSWKKQYGIFFLIATLTTAIFLPYQRYAESWIQRTIATAEPSGFRARWKTFTLRFPLHFEFENFEFMLKGFPFPTLLDNFNFHPQWSALLGFKPAVVTAGSFYGGTFQAFGDSSFSGSPVTATLDVTDVHLEQYPIGRFFGISGLLGIRANIIDAQSDFSLPPKRSSLDVHLRSLGYVGGHKIQGAVVLPPLTDGNGELTLSCEAELCELHDFHFDSSLGTVKGNGKFTIESQLIVPRLDSEFELTLSEIGLKAFGGYLALLAQQNIQTPSAHWKLRILRSPGEAIQLFASPLE